MNEVLLYRFINTTFPRFVCTRNTFYGIKQVETADTIIHFLQKMQLTKKAHSAGQINSHKSATLNGEKALNNQGPTV